MIACAALIPRPDSVVRGSADAPPRAVRRLAEDPKWTVDADWKPPRKISDKELEAARKMFFELDRDGSGSIDAEELGMMLRSLGQNPSDEELKELIDSVDDGDKDGQIQLREFLLLYTQGLLDYLLLHHLHHLQMLLIEKLN